MKIFNLTIWGSSPSEYLMNASNTFISGVKQNIGRITAHCRRWPIWVGGVSLSVSALFSTSVLAYTAEVMNWAPQRAIAALGLPVLDGENNNGKPVRYPPKGTRNLIGVFPPKSNIKFPLTSYPTVLKDLMLWVRAQNRLFVVPHVVTGQYTCEMAAYRKDRTPGIAKATLFTDAIVVNRDLHRFTGDSNVMESKLVDLYYSVTCKGTGFSWQRKPEEKVKFESDWKNGVPSIEMRDCKDPRHYIYNVVFWSPPDGLNPNFKDPAIVLQSHAENNDNQQQVTP
ncbi:hypothetical protein [Photorhabdus heterorhabditis]|uniref:hypothetical protein n=1 Tax=Photorhabdus heterorhabditis TaxID=880156 RepID=UPI001FD3CB7F|nr:hypothetical protein [Photorhabdus heterorhabditis]